MPVYCEDCGHEISPNKTHCRGCGSPVTPTVPVVTSTPRDDNGNKTSVVTQSRERDVPHCSICHLPKVGHECTEIQCPNASVCGKSRLHNKSRRPSKRRERFDIFYFILKIILTQRHEEQDLDEIPFPEPSQALSLVPQGGPASQHTPTPTNITSTNSDPVKLQMTTVSNQRSLIETKISAGDQLRQEELRKARSFIWDFSDWLVNRYEPFQSDNGKVRNLSNNNCRLLP